MIIFSEHALLKLKQRNISQSLVIKSLEFPDHTFDSCGERKIVYKKFGRLYLKVVYTKEETNIIVITQHWEESSKLIRKKWK